MSLWIVHRHGLWWLWMISKDKWMVDDIKGRWYHWGRRCNPCPCLCPSLSVSLSVSVFCFVHDEWYQRIFRWMVYDDIIGRWEIKGDASMGSATNAILGCTMIWSDDNKCQFRLNKYGIGFQCYLGALRTLTSSWRPFGPLNFVLNAFISQAVWLTPPSI